jgi:protocatechuate 3,4-dioxygenase alpha subunit
VNLFSRGVLKQMVTRIYVSDEDANSGDPVLGLVPEDRRATLIATRRDGDGQALYAFDFRMQGQDETVFFEA